MLLTSQSKWTNNSLAFVHFVHYFSQVLFARYWGVKFAEQARRITIRSCWHSNLTAIPLI